MDAGVFKETVRTRAKLSEGLSDKGLNEAIGFWVESMNPTVFQKEDVRKCIELAGRMSRLSASHQPPPAGAAESPGLAITPDMVIASDWRADAIRPWVEQARQELFGSTKPPFASCNEAVEWLEKLGKEQRDLGRDSEERDRNLQVVQYERLERGDVYKRHDILFIKEPRLELLKDTSEEMALATGFPQPWVIDYILADKRPLLPSSIMIPRAFDCLIRTGNLLRRARPAIEINPPGNLLRRITINIEINLPLSFPQLRDLYRTAMKALNITRTKSANAYDLQLFEIVRSHGGEPKQGTVAFWKKILRELEEHRGKKNGQKHPKTWEGVKKRYHRLEERKGWVARRNPIVPQDGEDNSPQPVGILAPIPNGKKDKQVELALKWIVKQGGKTTAREILRYRVAGVKTSDEAKELLQKLVKREYGVLEEGKKGSIIFSLVEEAV